MLTLPDIASAAAGPLLGWLARASAEAAVVAVVVLAAQAALGRWLPPAWRHRLWGLVVLRLVLPVPPGSPASVWNVVPAWAGLPGVATALDAAGLSGSSAANPDAADGDAGTLTPTGGAGSADPTRRDSAGVGGTTADRASVSAAGGRSRVKVTYGYGPLALADGSAASAGDQSAAAAAGGTTAGEARPGAAGLGDSGGRAERSGRPAATGLVALAAVWLAGAVLLLGRLVLADAAFARRLRSAARVTDPAVLALLAACARRVGLSRAPPVLETDAVGGPAAAGVWRPRLLVPPGLLAALTPAERRVVLLHELAHVRRHDVAANWVLAIVQAVHWFNPVVWLAFARLRADRELARDAMVLALGGSGGTAGEPDAADPRASGQTFSDQYAGTLLKLAARASGADSGLGAAATSPGFVGMVGDADRSPGSAGRHRHDQMAATTCESIAPGLLGRRAGLQRRLKMITGFPATAVAARRFGLVGPVLFVALACGMLTGPRAAAEPTAAAADTRPAVLPAAFPQATRPATEPAADVAGQVKALIAEARNQAAKGDYRAAMAAVDKILFRDPINEYALGVRPLLEDQLALLARRSADVRRAAAGLRAVPGGERPTSRPTSRPATDASPRIPYDDILSGSRGGWPDISTIRDRADPAERGQGAEGRAVQAQLERKLPEVNFDDVGFGDVVDFLRDVGQTNIFVNWKALAAVGVDRASPVSVRLRDVRFGKALTVVLDSVSKPKARLGYTIDEGVISISTTEDLAKNVLTRVYDVRDLLVVVPDYTDAPNLGLGTWPSTRPVPATVPTTVPATAATTQPADPANARKAAVDAVVRLVTQTIDPDSWRENGGSVGAIKELSGQLVVTQTPENHRDLTHLIEQLHEGKSIQVTVEGRFISCDDGEIDGLIARWRKEAAATRPASRPAADPAAAAGGLAKTRPAAGDGADPATAGVFLTNPQADELLAAIQRSPAASVVTAPRLTVFNGQRAYVLVSTQRAYVRDFATVVAAGGETRYEPIIDTVEAGVMLDVQATASANRQYVSLSLRPRLSAMTGKKEVPWPGRPAGSTLTVQEPVVKTSELRTLVSVPDGGTVLFGGLEDPGLNTGPLAADPANPPPTTGPATTRASARPGRRMYLLVRPVMIVQNEVEQRQFPLLNTRQ
jgi:beta-lactamase regulating signal transducer with metallopeptidase domain